MATLTGGTTTTSVLTALAFSAGADMLDADIATICLNIKDDVLSGHKVVPNAFSRNGQLFIPNRGVLKLLPGDYVMVDTNSGWPILVSGNVIGVTSTPWAHS